MLCIDMLFFCLQTLEPEWTSCQEKKCNGSWQGENEGYNQQGKNKQLRHPKRAGGAAGAGAARQRSEEGLLKGRPSESGAKRGLPLSWRSELPNLPPAGARTLREKKKATEPPPVAAQKKTSEKLPPFWASPQKIEAKSKKFCSLLLLPLQGGKAEGAWGGAARGGATSGEKAAN